MVFFIVMLTFAVFAIVIMWRPASIMAFAVCVYPFEQWAQANSSYFAANSTVINYALGLLTLFALACVIMRGKNPLNPTTSAMWVWLALYIYAGMSCIWSPDRDTSFFLFRYHAPYAITFVALLPLIIQKPNDVRIGLLATLVFGSFVMVLLFWNTSVHAWGRTIEVAHGVGVVDRVGQTRTRLSALSVAETAGQILIIATLMNFSGVGRVWLLLRWAIVFLALALIYRSGSRGQLFAAIMAILVFITFSRGALKARGWITAAATIAIIMAVSTYTYLTYASTGRWDLDRMTAEIHSTRLEFSLTLLDYWMESSPANWLFGLGSSASYDNRILGFYCHVVSVEVLAELGVFGFALLTTLVLLVVRDGFRLYKSTKSSDVDRGTTIALCALFFFQIILTFKERSFLSHTFTLCCGLMIARYAAVVSTSRKRERTAAMKTWIARQSQPRLQPVQSSSQ